MASKASAIQGFTALSDQVLVRPGNDKETPSDAPAP